MRSREQFGYPGRQGLYDPAFEKDSCGVGFVAHIKGERSHQILVDAYKALTSMDHRGARGCEPNKGGPGRTGYGIAVTRKAGRWNRVSSHQE